MSLTSGLQCGDTVRGSVATGADIGIFAGVLRELRRRDLTQKSTAKWKHAFQYRDHHLVCAPTIPPCKSVDVLLPRLGAWVSWAWDVLLVGYLDVIV